MTSIEATSVDLRPIRSPKWPNSIELTGRARNAMPKVRNAFSACASTEEFGKKICPRTRAAARP